MNVSRNAKQQSDSGDSLSEHSTTLEQAPTDAMSSSGLRNGLSTPSHDFNDQSIPQQDKASGDLGKNQALAEFVLNMDANEGVHQQGTSLVAASGALGDESFGLRWAYESQHKRALSAASPELDDDISSKRSRAGSEFGDNQSVLQSSLSAGGTESGPGALQPTRLNKDNARDGDNPAAGLKESLVKTITGIQEDGAGNMIFTALVDPDELASGLISDVVRDLVRGDDDFEMDSEDEGDVAAVLGASSDKECSYQQGYVKRQALYSCQTCYAQSKEVAGICLACTYACHEGHDLVEMYTKRNFRCDCGNSKFSGLACKLVPRKEIVNELNSYNQNFVNNYCTCHRPYPDETAPDKAQVQCLMCEDWFHLEHVVKDLSNMEIQLQEDRSLICAGCRRQHPFVDYYVAEEDDQVAVFDAKEPNCQIDGCGLKFLKAKFAQLPAEDEAAWTTINWYQAPCTCKACKTMYAAEKVEYLLDEDESADAYGQRGHETRAAERAAVEQDVRDPIQAVVSHLPTRFAQIEFATDVNRLRESIRDKMADWAQQGKIVEPSDVTDFFTALREQRDRERQRRHGPDA